MVLLKTTPFIHSTLSTLPPSKLTSLSTPLPPAIGAPIEHTTLIALSHLTKPAITLASLLRGTSVYTPPPPPRPVPSPEYLALKAQLLEAQDRRAYAALINNKPSSYSLLTDSSADNDESTPDDITPSLVVNILLSIILCAAATFILTRWWASDGIRVLVSLLVGVVVGVAETGVYAGYLRKVERARRVERRKREVKSIIGEYTGEAGGEAVGLSVGVSDKVDDEGEEIWGRGANGGMRRRVREKWEKGQVKEKEGNIEVEDGKEK